MSELPYGAGPDPDNGGTYHPESTGHPVSGGGEGQSPSPPNEPFVVGYGDFEAIVDQIEVVQPDPSPREDSGLAGYRFTFTGVVAKLRDRAAGNRTGQPLAVRLDRRLFLPANTDRRHLIEDDILAMQGLSLQDGRTLQVEETLGRFGDRLGGLDGQLAEIGHRLKHGQEVRLAVCRAVLSDRVYRRLGQLKDRHGDQLNFCVDGTPKECHELAQRLIQEALRARMESVRQRLQSGRPAVLKLQSIAMVRSYYHQIVSLRQRFGDQLQVEIDASCRQADAISAAWRAEQRQARTRRDLGTSSSPSSPPRWDDGLVREDPQRWARELAARVRKPWWQRTRWYRKLTGGDA